MFSESLRFFLFQQNKRDPKVGGELETKTLLKKGNFQKKIEKTNFSTPKSN